MSENVRAHIYIKGDVVGVGFRAWTKIQAKIHGITGWVRNNHEKTDIFGAGGGVEAVLSGDSEQVKKFIETIRKGSPISHVSEVDVLWLEPNKKYNEFEIHPTIHSTVGSATGVDY